MAKVRIEDVQALLTKEVHIVLDDNNNAVAYEIITGQFKGVRYAYQDVKVEHVENSDSMELEFNSIIFNRHEFPDIDDLAFKQYIADIYIKILEHCAV